MHALNTLIPFKVIQQTIKPPPHLLTQSLMPSRRRRHRHRHRSRGRHRDIFHRPHQPPQTDSRPFNLFHKNPPAKRHLLHDIHLKRTIPRPPHPRTHGIVDLHPPPEFRVAKAEQEYHLVQRHREEQVSLVVGVREAGAIGDLEQSREVSLAGDEDGI